MAKIATIVFELPEMMEEKQMSSTIEKIAIIEIHAIDQILRIETLFGKPAIKASLSF